jgi:hypothetical protein
MQDVLEAAGYQILVMNTERQPEREQAALKSLLAHDVAGMHASMPPDFHFTDHRRSGIGQSGTGANYAAWLAAAIEDSRDLAVEILWHVAIEDHGRLAVGRSFGTLRGGGPFESVILRLDSFDGDRWLGIEVFEPEDLERAKARFAELRAGRTDVLRIPPNAATRAIERWAACAAAQDWDGLEALFAPDMTWEDRRPIIRDGGDREKMLASIRVAARGRAARSSEATVLATYGDRLALTRLLFSDAARSFEIEILQVEPGAGPRFMEMQRMQQLQQMQQMQQMQGAVPGGPEGAPPEGVR